MKHIYLILAFTVLFLLTACESEGTDRNTSDGKLKVELLLPGTYGAKATTRDSYVPKDLDPIPAKTALAEGSTLWVIIEKKVSDGVYTRMDPHPYKVVASSQGYLSLYPMYKKEEVVDGNTVIAPDLDADPSEPLYLETGTYRFRMLSPAKPLEKNTYKATVNNGEYLYATDERYNQTKPYDIEVTPAASSASEDNVQRIVLNPMIQQVARMKFTLVKGPSAHSMDIYPDGIEVTGLQNIPEGVTYNWGSESVADTLEMKRGDKRGIVYVKDIVKDETTDEISGHVGVLPTNAESNSIIVLFNLIVNGVPTQYSVMLNKAIFLHAHSYNYKFRIDIDNGIAVATPLYASWTVETSF